MTRLGKAFNLSDSIRIKTFELGNHTFKVKVPLSNELEKVNERIYDVDKEEVQNRLKKSTDILTKDPIEGVEVTEDDVIVNGTSTKDTITAVLQMEKKIVEYIRFLVPEEGEINDLTYEEIEAEFPLQVQLELLEKITEVIQPGYKDARKN